VNDLRWDLRLDFLTVNNQPDWIVPQGSPGGGGKNNNRQNNGA
jgi:hypothetical protein